MHEHDQIIAELHRTHSSAHNEMASAVEDARIEARAGAFAEAIEFLRGSGFDDAAAALDMAAFGRPGS